MDKFDKFNFMKTAAELQLNHNEKPSTIQH
jgi:hypothetical protein